MRWLTAWRRWRAKRASALAGGNLTRTPGPLVVDVTLDRDGQAAQVPDPRRRPSRRQRVRERCDRRRGRGSRLAASATGGSGAIRTTRRWRAACARYRRPAPRTRLGRAPGPHARGAGLHGPERRARRRAPARSPRRAAPASRIDAALLPIDPARAAWFTAQAAWTRSIAALERRRRLRAAVRCPAQGRRPPARRRDAARARPAAYAHRRAHRRTGHRPDPRRPGRSPALRLLSLLTRMLPARFKRWLEQLLHTHDTPRRTAAAYALGRVLRLLADCWVSTRCWAFAAAFLFNLNRLAVILGIYSNLPWILPAYYTLATLLGAAILRVEVPPGLLRELTDALRELPGVSSASWPTRCGRWPGRSSSARRSAR